MKTIVSALRRFQRDTGVVVLFFMILTLLILLYAIVVNPVDVEGRIEKGERKGQPGKASPSLNICVAGEPDISD